MNPHPITSGSIPQSFIEDSSQKKLDPQVHYEEGLILKKQGLHKQAAESFFAAANGGHAEAYFELGLFLETGTIYLAPSSIECFNKAGDSFFDGGNFASALKSYEKVLIIEKERDATSPSYAAALNATGKCHYSLGDFSKAISNHQQAVAIFKDSEDSATTLNYLSKAQLSAGLKEAASSNLTLALEKGFSNQRIRANTLSILGELKQEEGKFTESCEHFLECLKIQKALSHEPDMDVANSLCQLGCVYIHLSELDKALFYTKEALQMRQGLLGSVSHPTIADSLHNMGSVLEGLGSFEEALGYFKDALKMDREVRGADAEHSDIAISLGHIGNILSELGRFAEAKEYYTESKTMSETINYSAGIERSLMDLGDLSIDIGLFDDSIDYYTKALEMRRKRHESHPDHTGVATSLSNLANAYMIVDRIDEAFECYQESLTMLKRIFGEETNHASIAILVQHVGDIHKARGHFQKALGYYDQCLTMQKKVLNTEMHPHIFVPLHKKGEILAHLGRFSEALECMEQALGIKRAFYKTSHFEISQGLNSLGKILERLGRFDEALNHFEEALKMDERGYAAIKTQHICSSLQNLSSCQGSLGSFRNALGTEEKALAAVQNFYGKENSKTAHSLRHSGVCLYSLGRYKEALNYYSEALKIYKSVYGDKHPEVATTLSHTANLHAATQNFSQAKSDQNEAYRILRIFYDPTHPIIANSLSDMASYLFSTDVQGALEKYKEAHVILEGKFGSAHPEVMLAATCIDICSQVLRGKIVEKGDEKTGYLNLEDFRCLINYALENLKSPASLKVEKNPSGFFRIRITIPSDFHLADKIEIIRLHYWPPRAEKIKIVEARHDHPRYFESMILNGGYTHHVYKKAEMEVSARAATQSLRVHRIIKAPNSQQRTIFCLGAMNLEDSGPQNTEKNMILHFPKSLVHQVESYQSGTLTINAVFKGEKDLTYFDIFMPEGNHLDPERERDFLEPEESRVVISEIRSILNNWSD